MFIFDKIFLHVSVGIFHISNNFLNFLINVFFFFGYFSIEARDFKKTVKEKKLPKYNLEKCCSLFTASFSEKFSIYIHVTNGIFTNGTVIMLAAF